MSTATTTRYAPLAAALVVWLLLWPLCLGLFSITIGSIITSDATTRMWVDIGVAPAVLLLLVFTHQQMTKSLFSPQWTAYLYLLPLVALITMVFRVGGIDGMVFGYPVWLYTPMIATNVALQQLLTFGLLQSYCEKVIPPALTIAIITIVFYLGHGIFISEKFASNKPLAALFIVIVGLAFAMIRQRTHTLHANLALYLLFYFIVIA